LPGKRIVNKKKNDSLQFESSPKPKKIKTTLQIALRLAGAI
jgi:hypothetical protein